MKNGILKDYWRIESLTMLLLGIASGLPILLIFGTLSVWLREADVARSTISFLSWAGLSYGFKFIWAPLLDSVQLPYLTKKLGRRRSWLLIAQLLIIASLCIMASFNPAHGHNAIVGLAIGAVLLGFASASQDIVIDAYRIEISDSDYQAMLSGIAVAGYRIGMLMAGAGVLQMADSFSADSTLYDYRAWQLAYWVMASIMGLAIVVTMFIKEPKNLQLSYLNVNSQLRLVLHFVLAVVAFIACFNLLPPLMTLIGPDIPQPHNPIIDFFIGALRLLISITVALAVGWLLCMSRWFEADVAEQVYIAPFRDFFKRYGKMALWLLAIICLYRSADIVMGVIAKVFYVDMGYSKSQIGKISFGFGLIMTLLGGIVGGIMSIRYGLYRMLLLGAIIAPLSNIVFVYLATLDQPSTQALIAAIMVDNLAGGLAGTVAVAFISSLVDKRFSASQYAVLTAITVLLPKLLAGYSGSIVNAVGYAPFFILSALIGIPVILLIIKIKAPYKQLFIKP